MSPRRLFRIVAVTEACTWALLLLGMVAKYGTETTELGVRVGGMAHGVAFVAYVLTTLVVATDATWTPRRTITGLLAAVPPFVTIWFDLVSERQGALPDRWRLADAAPAGPRERLVSWLVRRPLQGVAVGVVAVAALTGAALMIGPPTS